MQNLSISPSLISIRWDELCVGRLPCDQIWRNFATLAKTEMSLAILWVFISYLAKIVTYLGKFVCNWAICHGCKWTNDENYKSHLVTLVGWTVSLTRQSERERNKNWLRYSLSCERESWKIHFEFCEWNFDLMTTIKDDKTSSDVVVDDETIFPNLHQWRVSE